MPEPEGAISPQIDAYIAECRPEVRDALTAVRTLVHEVAPDVSERMAYGIPTFALHGKNLVHMAAHPTHIGFYPTPSGVEHFAARLTSYKTSKGAIQFPLTQPLPLDLIREITEFRVGEVQAQTSRPRR